MTRRTRWRPPTARAPRLGAVVTFILAAAGTALWFALTGPAGRAGAVAGALAATASTLAALAAIHLSREALARTDQQLALARRAVVLSRYPLLLPIHQSVTFPDSCGIFDAHPPTKDRFKLDSAHARSYAFVADTKNTFIIPIENVGEGPALRVAGRLWRSDGAVGDLVGPSALGTGRIAIMTARLRDTTDLPPSAFGEAIQVAGDHFAGDYFWLDLRYIDVFGNPLDSCALFDPRGVGTWHQAREPEIEAAAEERQAGNV